MSPDELERFATRRVWPARFRNRLGAAGFAPSSDRAPGGCGSTGAATPSGSGAAPDARPYADVSDASSDDPAGDDARATSPTTPAAPPSPEPPAMRAPSQPTRPPEPLESQAPHAWQRPEDRVFAPRRPTSDAAAPWPAADGPGEAAAPDSTDPIAEAKRARAPRDRRW